MVVFHISKTDMPGSHTELLVYQHSFNRWYFEKARMPIQIKKKKYQGGNRGIILLQFTSI